MKKILAKDSQNIWCGTVHCKYAQISAFLFFKPFFQRYSCGASIAIPRCQNSLEKSREIRVYSF